MPSSAPTPRGRSKRRRYRSCRHSIVPALGFPAPIIEGCLNLIAAFFGRGEVIERIGIRERSVFGHHPFLESRVVHLVLPVRLPWRSRDSLPRIPENQISPARLMSVSLTALRRSSQMRRCDLGKRSMSEDKNIYTWVHPDILRVTRGEKDLGYMIRNWLPMSVELDHFSITRARNFYDVEAGMSEISGTYKIDRFISAYDEMSEAEKRVYGSRQRRLAEAVPYDQVSHKNVDGYFLIGSGTLKNGDTVFVDHVQNFEGKRSSPLYVPPPSQHTVVRVTLSPSSEDRIHGGISLYENYEDPRVTIPVPNDALEGVLDDLNRSREKKKIVVRFSVLLYSFEEGGFDLPSRTTICLLPRDRHSPAILNGVDVVAYERDRREKRQTSAADG